MNNLFQLPIPLILKMFNALPLESPTRAELIDFIREFKKSIDAKGHKAEGFMLSDTGELYFDEKLYDEAIYRGKIETYSRVASDKIEKLRQSLEMLKTMGESHANALSALDADKISKRIGEGEPISGEQMKLLEKLMPVLLNDEA